MRRSRSAARAAAPEQPWTILGGAAIPVSSPCRQCPSAAIATSVAGSSLLAVGDGREQPFDHVSQVAGVVRGTQYRPERGLRMGSRPMAVAHTVSLPSRPLR